MSISELINQLIELREKHGDLECKIPDSCGFYESIGQIRYMDLSKYRYHAESFIAIYE